MRTKIELIEHGREIPSGYTGTVNEVIGRHRIRVETFDAEPNTTVYRYNNKGRKEYYTVHDITGETTLVNITS